MSKTLFDHIKAITQTQDPKYWESLTDGDKKSWSNYMINRFLSMNEEWVDTINELQLVTQSMDPELVYKTYIGILPKSRRFLKYIKSAKTKEFESWLTELMAKHFEIGENQADDYLRILYSSDNGRIAIKEICESYGITEKEIKKLKL